ncbi:uncharacterized protein OCT59_019174 [Rhizophagus irregularis]|uniref:Kic1p n=3 Tax=Rhizophagus irregularis TaxID=588596 RepID=A0A015MVJ0_RHIIW|nr:Kic1p [Rhizophagus irregularis DAOM 197198w]UZO26964.1 hypothetical protein OCT59_019174 [Rhizophagus irregularis]GBC33913.1 kinase-like domain-containing protein [Rhizophagus irregularis DAOM 181602=DAOM 197198]
MEKIFLKEWIDERINCRDINYFDYDEFNNLETLYRTSVKRANWENRKITVVLKVLNNSIITDNDLNEFINKLKALRMVYFHSNINRFFGITKDSNENYFSVFEYANKGSLRSYLKNKFNELQWNDKVRMALDISHGLMCLHSKKIVHSDLHACNILVHNGRLAIAGFGSFEQATKAKSEFKNMVYIEPQYLRNSIYKRDMRSDIYSLGVLLWELTSGRPPFSNYLHDLAQIKKQLLNGLREDQIESTPLEYVQLYQKCWHDDPNVRPEINEIFKILSQLLSQFDVNEKHARLTYDKSISDDNSYMELDYKEMPGQSSCTAKIVAEIFGSLLNEQQIIKRFKLNHGLILTRDNIRPSKQAIIAENGELKIDLYEGQPLVYTYINSEDNNDKPLDICIIFPVAEMIYNGNLLDSYSNCMDVDEVLHELYGHFTARKFLVGSRLFIKDFNLATITQIDILKFYLYYVYHLTKCSTEIQFGDLFTLNLLPKIVTLDGEELDSHEKLTRWMDNLHQKKMIDIISYDNLTPLQLNTPSMDDLENFNEKQPGIIDFKEKLNLKEWVGDAMHNNLVGWIKDFQLFQGLLVNKNYKIVNSKKIVCNFIKIPEINLIDEFYLDVIKPITKLEQRLVSHDIFSIKDLSSFPFIRSQSSNIKGYEGYNHILVKYKKYEILLNTDYVKPTKEFEQVIEEALNSMRPLKALQDIFNEYGHLFPQRIVLGKCLKNVVPNPSSSNAFGIAINDVNEILNLLNDLNISSLLTQKGKIIEKKDLHNWIQNTDNHLEIIEFDNNIPLYNILKVEQREKIDDILRNNSSLIMTGITDLKDLNNNNVKHYKRINLNTSLESDDYEVFGSIISENNSKLEEFYVNFALFDFNGFYAIIKKSKETNIDVENCNIFWMIIGNPSKLSVFSPKNRRNIIVKYCKRSITLQPKQLNYHVEIPFPLLQDEFIFFNTTSKGFELRSTVKLIRWNHNSIDINFDPQLNNESNSLANTEISNNIDINICIISSYSVNLKIDNRKEEYPLNRIGDVLIAPVVSSFQELHIQNQDETPSGKDKYSNMVTRKRNMRHMRNIQKLYVQDQDEAPLRQSKYSSMVTVRRNKRNLIHAITHPTYPIIGNFVDQLRNGSPFL